MTRAKNREEFESAWNEHISHTSCLAHSLPSKEALRLLNLVKATKRYVKIAADHVYKEVRT